MGDGTCYCWGDFCWAFNIERKLAGYWCLDFTGHYRYLKAEYSSAFKFANRFYRNFCRRIGQYLAGNPTASFPGRQYTLGIRFSRGYECTFDYRWSLVERSQ